MGGHAPPPPPSDTLSWSRANQSLFFLLNDASSATNNNFIVFGLTQSGLKPTIYRIQGKHANHYNTDAITTSLLWL